MFSFNVRLWIYSDTKGKYVDGYVLLQFTIVVNNVLVIISSVYQ